MKWKWRDNEEMERDSLSTFLIFSLFPPRYDTIILGRIRCEKAPQVVPACLSANSLLSVTKDKIQITSFPESSLKVKLFADTLSDI